MQERTTLIDSIAPVDAVFTDIGNLTELMTLAKAENDASMEAEIEKEFLTIRAAYKVIETRNLFSGEFDRNNAYFSINAGAGGTESCDWVSMLLRMYMRFCESKGFSIELVDEMPGDEAGIRKVELYIAGPYAYGYLRAEIGVHRLVRISPFDSNARRHTSFAAVAAMPELDDSIDIEINPADIRVDTYRASGAGGQKVNKTSSAIRITHIPTNIVVTCQNERSQYQNKDRAMSMLKAKLYQAAKEKQDMEKAAIAGEKKDIAWGHQIRSYVFQPYQMVKDLRTDHEVGNIQSVMDGKIEEFIYAYLKMGVSERSSS